MLINRRKKINQSNKSKKGKFIQKTNIYISTLYLEIKRKLFMQSRLEILTQQHKFLANFSFFLSLCLRLLKKGRNFK